MRNVHFYFFKTTRRNDSGGQRERPVEAPLQTRSRQYAAPEVYLQFGRSDGTVGRLVKCVLSSRTGRILACLFYRVGAFTVNVIFAQAGAVGITVRDMASATQQRQVRHNRFQMGRADSPYPIQAPSGRMQLGRRAQMALVRANMAVGRRRM